MQCVHKHPRQSVSMLQSPEFEFHITSCVKFRYLIMSSEMVFTVDVTSIDGGHTSTTQVDEGLFTWDTKTIFLPIGERFKMVFNVASSGQLQLSSRIVKIDRIDIDFDGGCYGIYTFL